MVAHGSVIAGLGVLPSLPIIVGISIAGAGFDGLIGCIKVTQYPWGFYTLDMTFALEGILQLAAAYLNDFNRILGMNDQG